MGKYAQLVIGAAGAGKSSYCTAMANHLRIAQRRTVHIVNLDPAAEEFSVDPNSISLKPSSSAGSSVAASSNEGGEENPALQPSSFASIDIRELITVDKVMSELKLGPNGGLMYCMEYLMSNTEWLEEVLDDFDEDYLLVDCPGQIELYTHQPLMRNLVQLLQGRLGYRVCVVYMIDSHFITEPAKMMSGSLACLSAMLLLECPHINVLSKVDLLDAHDKELLELRLTLNPEYLVTSLSSSMAPKFAKLNEAFASVLSDFDLVTFLPLDPTDEDTLSIIQQTIDNALQFGDDAEVQIANEFEADEFND